MVTESPTVAIGVSRWHVTFGNPGAGVALRDYFRRLGSLLISGDRQLSSWLLRTLTITTFRATSIRG